MSATNCHKIDVSDFDKELATNSGERACRVHSDLSSLLPLSRRVVVDIISTYYGVCTIILHTAVDSF